MNLKTVILAFFLVLFLNVKAQHRATDMEGFGKLKTGNLLEDRYRTYGIPIGINEANIIITSNAANGNVVELHVKVDLITNIENLHQAGIFIYPNPTSGIFTIIGIANHAKVTLFNAYGVEVYRGEQALPAVIDLTEYPQGVYFLQVEGGGKVVFEKIIRN